MAEIELPPGAPAPLKWSVAKTPHDNLSLPDGRKLGQVPGLAAALVALQIPGASHSLGRADLAKLYAAHLEKMAEEAGRARVASWLAGPHGGRA
jgi:hypothetical protein